LTSVVISCDNQALVVELSLAPLIRSRPWRYINVFTYLLTYLCMKTSVHHDCRRPSVMPPQCMHWQVMLIDDAGFTLSFTLTTK